MRGFMLFLCYGKLRITGIVNNVNKKSICYFCATVTRSNLQYVSKVL